MSESKFPEKMMDPLYMDIVSCYEKQRKCGYRKPGGLYMVCDRPEFHTCDKLPLKLDVCPVCHSGIKPSRGFTWINPVPLFENVGCFQSGKTCGPCPLSRPKISIGDRAGLVWIGERFYEPDEWQAESEQMGVSRRIPAVPNGFEIGIHWVFVAHRRAVSAVCGCEYKDECCDLCGGVGWRMKPAIVQLFRPDRIEYVVKPDDPRPKLERLVKRGITLVNVIRMGDDGQPLMPLLSQKT